MKWLPPLVFAGVLLGHFLYVTPEPAGAAGPWADYDFDASNESRLDRYTASGNYWLGLSYGLSGAFASWSFLYVLKLRRQALATGAGGVTLAGVLWAGVCFLTGCCGSPMLPVYLSLLGPTFLSVTKPLTFVITLVSITVGLAWMLRRTRKAVA